jgi:choline dehydrogenase
VVGGGTAGNAIGVRLAEAGFSVAIIEAGIFYEIGKPVFFGIGSSFIDAVPTVDWQFQTEPQAGANNRRLHYARGKCLGGSSALNFMIHHRGSKGSYEQWADMVGDDSYK